jgi:hypothetical protein
MFALSTSPCLGSQVSEEWLGQQNRHLFVYQDLSLHGKLNKAKAYHVQG